jgi:hypothetical protein
VPLKILPITQEEIDSFWDGYLECSWNRSGEPLCFQPAQFWIEGNPYCSQHKEQIERKLGKD